MINLLYFNIDSTLKEEIEIFTVNSCIQNIIFQSTDDLNEFKTIYLKNCCDIIIIDPSKNKNEIISLLEESQLSMSKLIIFSSVKADAFEFINFNVFGFLIYPLDVIQILTVVNKCLNKIAVENESLQFKVSKKKFQKFIAINSVKKIELIKTHDISYFEADGRYTIVYLKDGSTKMASKNLGEFQKVLNPDVFCRIHHKFIINMNYLLNILKSDGYYCEMINNKNIPVSKRKLENLNAIMNLGKTSI